MKSFDRYFNVVVSSFIHSLHPGHPQPVAYQQTIHAPFILEVVRCR
jgi:hypothetical protein